MSNRPKMLASAVREIVAPALRECPPECGIVSITEIEVSADFSYATVYVSALEHSKKALDFLKGNLRELQREMGKLQVHRIPLLRFRLDMRTERGGRIDRLLDELHKKDSEDTSRSSQE